MKEHTDLKLPALWLTMAMTLALSSSPSREVVAQQHNSLGTTEPQVVKLSDGLYTFSYQGIRNIFVVTKEGVITTDPISAETAKQMRSAISTVTDKTVKYVVYSHNHWDRTRGGKIFKDEGAQFVSHFNCVKHFYRRPHPEVVRPDITFTGASYELILGKRLLKLYHLGHDHSDCLIIMKLADTSMLFIVDLVTPYGVSGAMGLMNDYQVKGWIRSLRKIEAMPDWQSIISGHGPAKIPRTAVTERRQYLEALTTFVGQEMARGTPRAGIFAKLEQPEFRHLQDYNPHLINNAERVGAYFAIGW